MKKKNLKKLRNVIYNKHAMILRNDEITDTGNRIAQNYSPAFFKGLLQALREIRILALPE
jgi:hypothetical protein